METGKTYEWQAGKGYLIALLVQAIGPGQDSDTSVTSQTVFYLLFAGVMGFFMQTGFAMLAAGSVRQKNVMNIILKSILDDCGGALGFWSVGYAQLCEGADSSQEHSNIGFCFLGGSLFSWGRALFTSPALLFVKVTRDVYPVAVYSVEATSDEEGEFKLDIAMNIGQPDEADENEDVPNEVVEYIQEKLNAIFTEVIRILIVFYPVAIYKGNTFALL